VLLRSEIALVLRVLRFESSSSPPTKLRQGTPPNTKRIYIFPAFQSTGETSPRHAFHGPANHGLVQDVSDEPAFDAPSTAGRIGKMDRKRWAFCCLLND
jgi:hypothetical protein